MPNGQRAAWSQSLEQAESSINIKEPHEPQRNGAPLRKSLEPIWQFDIKRDDEFYLFKMQEELGELTRAFLELRGSEKKRKANPKELKKKFSEDIAVLVGNALILALHFEVDLEATIKSKFPPSI